MMWGMRGGKQKTLLPRWENVLHTIPRNSNANENVNKPSAYIAFACGNFVFVLRWYSKMFFQKYLKDFPGSKATFTVILLLCSPSYSSARELTTSKLLKRFTQSMNVQHIFASHIIRRRRRHHSKFFARMRVLVRMERNEIGYIL